MAEHEQAMGQLETTKQTASLDSTSTIIAKPETSHKCTHKHQKKDKKKKKKKHKSKQETDTDSMSSSDSSSEDERVRRRKIKQRRRKVPVSETESSSEEEPAKRKKKTVSGSESSGDELVKKRKKRKNDSESEEEVKKKKKKKHTKAVSESDTEVEPKKKKRSKAVTESESESEDEPVKKKKRKSRQSNSESSDLERLEEELKALKLKVSARKSGKKKKSNKSTDFCRVDEAWDMETRNYKLKDSQDVDESEFKDYAFVVRRRIDYEGQHVFTLVDIKHPALRKGLIEVMKDKSMGLEAEEPTLEPNTLYLYLSGMKEYRKNLKAQIKKERSKKAAKQLTSQRDLMKLMITYIDEDYSKITRTLQPMLKAGNITFDLMWSLYRQGELIVTSTYGNWDEPRCFKVESCYKSSSLSKGEFYSIDGKYLECAATFGMGDFETEIESFKGVRKISSLPAYPLKYHPKEAEVRRILLERGRKFVQYAGMNYRVHKGLAFMKKKKQILKIHLNGRVMVDPQTFRRINANYPVSSMRPKDDDLFSESSEDESDCSCSSAGEEHLEELEQEHKEETEDQTKTKYQYVKDKTGRYTRVEVEVDENGDRIIPEKIDDIEPKESFSEEELLLASSVVLGFAFSEKLWLEFTVSGLSEIQYNEGAFESLVLPESQKSIVKALVESHKQNAGKTIDDVVQGKGRSLVIVLHGSPGTGKTLTAESIAELLQVPLYIISAGELGTDAGKLEFNLNQILEISSIWNALVLIDEADVFLERREMNDVHRNSLVCVFLRLLEYFQGILFLTTNRISTFDEAFASRIHLALKYVSLKPQARAQVWRMFLGMCQRTSETAQLTDAEFESLARHELNGRQIKNIVRTAQALCLHEGTTLGLKQITQVIDVARAFDKEMKGGSGFDEAMRSYT